MSAMKAQMIAVGTNETVVRGTTVSSAPGEQQHGLPFSMAFSLCDYSASRGLAGDVVNVRAVDADVLQFAVRIGRQFVQDVPVATTLFQKAGDD